MTIDKTPSLPNTDAEAITFALDRLEPFEVADFLSDYRDGKDLTPWLDAWHQDRRAA
ncbi:hypothetical protein [Manganibacter manganicus]|uniref:hypothetical protein n=1 Tax=Manganibacter manganicus TaxID=1873176 RepID=UPI00178CC448|nr:hypothetical protein [Pseudaminobacter manganicus]